MDLFGQIAFAVLSIVFCAVIVARGRDLWYLP